MIDLNTFLPSGADLLQLTDAYNINDRGEIVGLGTPPGCDDEFTSGRVFVRVPCDDDQSAEEGCQEGRETSTATPRSRAAGSPSTAIVTSISLIPREMLDRMRVQFGWSPGGLGRWSRLNSVLQPSVPVQHNGD